MYFLFYVNILSCTPLFAFSLSLGIFSLLCPSEKFPIHLFFFQVSLLPIAPSHSIMLNFSSKFCMCECVLLPQICDYIFLHTPFPYPIFLISSFNCCLDMTSWSSFLSIPNRVNLSIFKCCSVTSVCFFDCSCHVESQLLLVYYMFAFLLTVYTIDTLFMCTCMYL